MTGFAKFVMVITIVGTITYLALQQYGNLFNESVENTETKGNIGLKNTYKIYVHGMADGNLALQN